MASDQNTMQAITCVEHFVVRSYMISRGKARLLGVAGQALEFNGSYHAAASLDGVGLFAKGGVVARGGGEAHTSDSHLGVVDAELLELMELSGGHRRGHGLVDGLVDC